MHVLLLCEITDASMNPACYDKHYKTRQFAVKVLFPST